MDDSNSPDPTFAAFAGAHFGHLDDIHKCLYEISHLTSHEETEIKEISVAFNNGPGKHIVKKKKKKKKKTGTEPRTQQQQQQQQQQQ